MCWNALKAKWVARSAALEQVEFKSYNRGTEYSNEK
jgi:hypothetical protein